ncbi:lactoylglutathione lyase [Pedobacter westerhofensis]|uniref:Lactoylglutathione lyase n=1 Tax=Pedobacter westerhofensis TaxID=425512 RepID=A0A521F5S1_9SPHI|nr:VOC family protein [Pedobacter westerhofensis]SMO91499.1 lactoylglutathione lyase [Pedobacter westerhofensis]
MKPITAILTFAVILLSLNRSAAQTASNQPGATLNHIAVYVSDLNRSAAFYETLLNLQKIEEPFKDGRHVWFSLGAAGQMHLISGAKSGVKYDKNEHLCFSVASITDFIAKLDQQKLSYINWEGTAKAPTIRVDGVKQIYFQDPDGHWLEVNDQKKFQ